MHVKKRSRYGKYYYNTITISLNEKCYVEDKSEIARANKNGLSNKNIKDVSHEVMNSDYAIRVSENRP